MKCRTCKKGGKPIKVKTAYWKRYCGYGYLLIKERCRHCGARIVRGYKPQGMILNDVVNHIPPTKPLGVVMAETMKLTKLNGGFKPDEFVTFSPIRRYGYKALV